MKYFVIAPTLDAYHAINARFQLEPGLCFYCDSLREAMTDVMRNRKLGHYAEIWDATGHVRIPRFEQLLDELAARDQAA